MLDEKPRHVNLLDMVAFLVRWRRFLAAAVLSAAATVAVISFTITPRYRSTAVVRAAESSTSGLGGLISSKLSSLGALGNFVPSLGEVPGELFISMLKSRWMFERLIENFDLRQVYKMQSTALEDVIQMAQSRTSFELEPESQTIRIYVDDEDPGRSQSMARFLVDELDNRNQQLRSLNARQQREYLGQRLGETQATLTALEDSMVSLQMLTDVFDPDEQVKATIKAAAALEAEQLSTQIELEMNRNLFIDHTQPQFPQLKSSSIDVALQRLSRKKSADEDNWSPLLRLREAPQQAIAYVRLKRDIEVQQLLSAILIQQFEQAKLEEKRNTPTLLRLDPPAVPAKKSWPRRGLMVAAASLGALVLAIALAMVKEFFMATRDSEHPQHERVQKIQQSWARVRPRT